MAKMKFVDGIRQRETKYRHFPYKLSSAYTNMKL